MLLNGSEMNAIAMVEACETAIFGCRERGLSADIYSNLLDNQPILLLSTHNECNGI